MDIVNHFLKNGEVMVVEQLMPAGAKPSFDDKIIGREKPLLKTALTPERTTRFLCVTEFQKFTITSTF